MKNYFGRETDDPLVVLFRFALVLTAQICISGKFEYWFQFVKLPFNFYLFSCESSQGGILLREIAVGLAKHQLSLCLTPVGYLGGLVCKVCLDDEIFASNGNQMSGAPSSVA